ncbi:MAG: cobalamin-dependent protein [Candidatus Adiutrix sp.]|jgi:methanogenic corrinoid protein MtbC1|nr:cobalamin-dependent protein [Candidatus Adiutrix sp.]
MTTKNKAEIRRLVAAMVELETAETVRIARDLNNRAVNPIDIMTACEQALVEIGERYAAGEYFISGLIMAGEIMNRVITLVAPRMAENVVNMLRGKVIIGTVKGDIHGLGKNIAGALLSAYGFEVKDLGVDVPINEFVDGCRGFNPDIVGLSVLLTSCYPNLGETIQAIREERGQAAAPAIFISGAQVTPEHQKQYQADHYARTAFDTVRLCEKIVRLGLDA